MVFLAINTAALQSYMQLQRWDFPLWLTADVADTASLQKLRAHGVAFSTFNYAITAEDMDAIQGALWTIQEHHPHHTVWMGH